MGLQAVYLVVIAEFHLAGLGDEWLAVSAAGAGKFAALAVQDAAEGTGWRVVLEMDQQAVLLEGCAAEAIVGLSHLAVSLHPVVI